MIKFLIFIVLIIITFYTDVDLSLAESPLDNVCSGQGGVDCTIIRPDASVVCKNGTVEESYTIYSIQQCQETIENLVRQQSNFVAKSGCFSPSEMGCTEGQSYQSLNKHLANLGVANSELGKSELKQCRQQINSYKVKERNYKNCLLKAGDPGFSLPSNNLAQPILKAVFCPIFYGDNSTYDQTIDLCLCDKGYFLSAGKCVEASKICRSKLGASAFAKNGNCVLPQKIETPKPIAPLHTPVPTKTVPKPTYPKPTPSAAPKPLLFIATPSETPTSHVYNPNPYIYKVSPSPEIAFSNDDVEMVTTKNHLKTLVNVFVSGIKKLVKLF
jgi:hypothetical protein